MKRAFLVLLVLFALLAATTIQHTLSSPPTDTGNMMGLVPITDMVFALPTAIFAAGLIIVGLGLGAEFWRSVLPMCGADWVPTRRLTLLADAGLWCGWVTLGTCYAALPCIFPWLGLASPDSSSLYSSENYRLLLLIGLGTMIAVRLFNTYLPYRKGTLAMLMSAAVGLMAGQFWWNGLPIDFVALAILLPLGVLLLFPGKEQATNTPFVWLTITALALSLYATGFSQLIVNYPTGPTLYTEGWMELKLWANSLLLLPLIGLLIPALRQKLAAQRTAGAMAILSVLLYNWGALAAPVDSTLQGNLPLLPAAITYGTTLLCLCGLLVLRIRCHRKPKENLQN